LWWKLGALLVSVLLWYAIEAEPELVTSRAVPVYYQNLRADLLVVADVPGTVRVELRGPSRKLSPSALSDTSVRLDLSPVTNPGERTFTLSSADVNLPEGVTFLRAMPSQLRLAFDRFLEKDVPVEVRQSSPPPPGFRVLGKDVAPATLRIAGPEQHVQKIIAAQTDAIDLSGNASDASFRVNTFIDDPQVRLESSPIVTVKFRIGRIQ
jgi:YbbR domain-containing protein